MLFVGFALIFVYIAVVLGRWNPVEQRVRCQIIITSCTEWWKDEWTIYVLRFYKQEESL